MFQSSNYPSNLFSQDARWFIVRNLILGGQPHWPLEPLEPWILKLSVVLNLLKLCCINPQLSDTPTHASSIFDTRAFLERPKNCHFAMELWWFLKHEVTWGLEQLTVLVGKEVMMATRLLINHALSGHWIGRITHNKFATKLYQVATQLKPSYFKHSGSSQSLTTILLLTVQKSG